MAIRMALVPKVDSAQQRAPRAARSDIQGLRAFAVLAVVVDHLARWPGGGFVGVDVFFVISGFLITGLLLREQERTQHISFVGFYRRRIKRIIPAAVLVLLVTVVASRFVFFEGRWRHTVTDAIWAGGFSANWRFWAESTDYFAQGATSPLQHYWSLSIEEQFYFIWPWLMLLVFAVVSRKRSHQFGRTVIFGVITSITATSFVWAVVQTQESTAQAYFSTFTRVWELGVGAMLAAAIPWIRRMPETIRPPLAWVGLVGMVSSLWIISADRGFPAPAAALPVLATGLVIAAGTRADEAQQRFLWPLTNRGAGYVGDVSYSMYLWHFPIVILLGAYLGAEGWEYYTLAVGLLIVTTLGSYHLVEEPLRHSPFIDHFESHRARGAAIAQWWRTWSRLYTASGLVLLTVCFGVMTAAALTPHAPPTYAAAVDYAASASIATSPLGSDDGQNALTPAEVQLESDLDTALNATSWPSNLTPRLDSLASSDDLGREVGALCSFADPLDPSQCSFGDPSDPTMMVLGDSTGVVLLEMLRKVYGENYLIRGITRPGCPVSVDDVFETRELEDACHQHRKDAVRAIQQAHPDVLFIINAYGVVDNLGSGATGAAAIEEYRRAQATTLEKVEGYAEHIVLMSSAPRGPDLEDCATKGSTPADCLYTVPRSYPEVVAADASFVDRTVHAYDTASWFCSRDGECPPFAGNILLKRDLVHMTPDWAFAVAPIFKAHVDPWIRDKKGQARQDEGAGWLSRATRRRSLRRARWRAQPTA